MEEEQYNGRMGQLSAAAAAIILYVFSAGMLSCVCLCVCVGVRALRATMASGLHDPHAQKNKQKERKKQTNLAEIALRNHLVKCALTLETCKRGRERERRSESEREREKESVCE